MGQIRSPSGLPGTAFDCPPGESWGKSQVDLLLLSPSVRWRAQLAISGTSCHRPLSSVRSRASAGPRLLASLASQPQQGQRPRWKVHMQQTALSAASQNCSCSGAKVQRQAGRRAQPDTSSAGLGGLPGLLGHLTRPADASFWSELGATWAPISETQIKCPSILQKPRRAQSQPGLLPVFHSRVLPSTVRAPTAAAAHRPARGTSQIVHTPCEVGGCEGPVMGPWDIWSHGDWRNINNLRYADDTTLMAESEEELKSLLVRVKEEREKAALKLSIQKTKVMVPSLHGK